MNYIVYNIHTLEIVDSLNSRSEGDADVNYKAKGLAVDPADAYFHRLEETRHAYV